MGLDYALVHLKFNIPPALVLTFLYYPLLTRVDVYRILFLITVAVVWTTPWDSHLINTSIWTYPDHVILGPKFFNIPIEEVFFFVIQTYNTSLLYLFLSKATFHPVYLQHEQKSDRWRYYKLVGQLAIAFAFKTGLGLVKAGEHGTYFGLILVWAMPVIVLLWSLAYQFLIRLPLVNTVLPILASTLYLWVVDTLALRRGTWTIESRTKFGFQIWPHLEVEEAFFFLVTNVLIVFGQVAFDNAVAVLDAFPLHFPDLPQLPSPRLLVRALLLPAAAYDEDRLNGLRQAIDRLSRKSRSFYLASGVFRGRLRVDLVLLYSFCRVADDLVDNAASTTEATQWIKRLRTFLDLSYATNDEKSRDPNVGSIARFVVQTFPRDCQSALLQLQTRRLSAKPLYDLLRGFEMDLQYQKAKVSRSAADAYPIKNETDLDVYSQYVAGTVAQLCIELCLHHYPIKSSTSRQRELLASGERMGIALQYTNIARDIDVDAAIDRIYIPTAWLKKEKLAPADAIKLLNKRGAFPDAEQADKFFADKIERLRSRLLDQAFAFYDESRPSIEDLPLEVRASMRVAVESYMEIARTLRQKGYKVKHGRATVPKWRRLLVAWKALNA